MARISNIDWDKDIYAKGKQLNNWPFTEVISDVLEAKKKSKTDKPKILEIGCGACNNLWFAAEAGLDIYGLDMSSTAIEYGKNHLKKRGIHDFNLKVGDITTLDWEDSYFDIILDRGALTQNNYERISKCLDEAYRILKPNGVLLSYTLFGLNSTEISFGQKISRNTYDFFSEGIFSNYGLTSFFSKSDLKELFSQFENLNINKNSLENLNSGNVLEMYSLSCNKASKK